MSIEVKKIRCVHIKTLIKDISYEKLCCKEDTNSFIKLGKGKINMRKLEL